MNLTSNDHLGVSVDIQSVFLTGTGKHKHKHKNKHNELVFLRCLVAGELELLRRGLWKPDTGYAQ